jgi:hypothetical protein
MRVGDRTYPKCMPLLQKTHNMLKFGSANNFSGIIGEQALKGIVKEHAEKNTKATR